MGRVFRTSLFARSKAHQAVGTLSLLRGVCHPCLGTISPRWRTMAGARLLRPAPPSILSVGRRQPPDRLESGSPTPALIAVWTAGNPAPRRSRVLEATPIDLNARCPLPSQSD